MAKKLILIIAALFIVLLLGLIFMSMNSGLTDDLAQYETPELDDSLKKNLNDSEVEKINVGGINVRQMQDFVWT
ncbi:MAG: hypothetical protein MI748_04130, partial [Opitutales bacterium]|nr:hypothetical protein [Opitutales bacterium]